MNGYNLKRFLRAQSETFEIAYYELQNGKKESHWMWFMFPQIIGLGQSDMAIYYAIESLDEAKAYLQDETLNYRLNLLMDVLLSLETNNAVEILGNTDARKLWSSMTLFKYADSNNNKYQKIIDKYFEGKLDANTIGILLHQGSI